MCIREIDQVWTSDEPITAWKVVSAERRSQFKPRHRGVKASWPWLKDFFSRFTFVENFGEMVEYPRGETVSSTWPGLYCWATQVGAKNNDWRGYSVNQIIKVEIPAGTQFVEGMYNGYPVICARKIKVVT